MKALFIILVLISALCGGGLVFQASFNGALAKPLDSWVVATFFSFLTGTVFLTLIAPIKLGRVVKRKDKPADGDTNKPKLYMYIVPPVIGLIYVSSGTIIGPLLGFNLFFVCVVTGQVVGSTIADHVGLLGIPKQPITTWRAVVLLIVLLGSILAVVERFSLSTSSAGTTIAYCLLSVASGFLISWQAPVNAELTRRIKTQPNRVALWTFFVGAVVLLILWGILVLVDAPNSDWNETESWMYLGGPLGASYVVASILFTPIIGVATFFVSVIFGQLLFSTIIDVYGLLGFEPIPLTATRIVGVALVFLVVAFRNPPTKFYRSRGKTSGITDSSSSSEDERKQQEDQTELEKA